jgi:hypothetical protein
MRFSPQGPQAGASMTLGGLGVMNFHTVLGGDHAFDSEEVAILVLA